MTNWLRVLMVSYSFPPDAQVGALRSARFAKYLPENEIEPIVLGLDERLYQRHDRSVEIPANLRIERTGAWTSPLDVYGELKRKLMRPAVHSRARAEATEKAASTTAASTSIPRIRRHVKALFRIPDEHAGWYFPALHRASQIQKRERIDAVYSTSPPVISHLVARRLKVKYGLPWVMDLRDPWTHNVEAVQLHQMPPWHDALSARIEGDCVRCADRIICNTERLRQLFLKEYPSQPHEKFVTITNGFDDLPEIVSNIPPEFPGAVFHVGSLYAERRVDSFARGVMDLLDKACISLEELRIIFVGDVNEQTITGIQQYGPELLSSGILRLIPRVSWLDAQAMMANARVLLLLLGEHVLQIPAKFYEYLRTGRPMFAIARCGALTDMLDETAAGFWADPDDSNAVRDNFWRAFNSAGLTSAEARHRYSRFHYRHLSGRLAATIRQAIERNLREATRD